MVARATPVEWAATHFHYLDAARAVLMLVGVVFHAARVYTVKEWALKGPTTSIVFDGLALFLTSFRMPSFFVISGFFAALSLARWGPAGLLRKRAPRILIPFVATLLTVNIVQLYVLHVHGGGRHSFVSYVTSRELWGDFTSDRWLSHLWFLVCLIWYFLALAVAAQLLRGTRAGRETTNALRRLRYVNQPVLCLALLPLVHLGIMAVFAALPVLYRLRLVASVNEIATYAPFFFVGLLVYASPGLYEAMTRFNRGVLALTVPVVGYKLAAAAAPPITSLAGRLVDAYGDYLWTWVAIYWVLVFFRRTLPEPNATVRRLADSSYTIYLFHHATVIAVAVVIMDWPISIFLKYPIVVAVTFMFTFGLHQLIIRRVPLLSLLFNGHVRRARSPGQDAA